MTSPGTKVSRRSALKYVAAGAAVVVVGGIGGYYALQSQKQQATSQNVTIRAIAFAPGFAFPDLWDSKGKKLPRLLDFEKATGITVEMDFEDSATLVSKTAAALTNHTGEFDIVYADSQTGIGTWAPGFVEPLDQLAQQYPSQYLDLNDLYPSIKNLLSLGGHLYGLPYYTNVAAMFYRADILDKYGLALPHSIDELFTTLKSLQGALEKDGLKGKVFPMALRGAPNVDSSFSLQSWIYAYNGNSGWFENGASTADEIIKQQAKPAFTKTLPAPIKAYADAARTYSAPGVPTWDWPEAGTLFAHGDAVFYLPESIMWSWCVANAADPDIKKNIKLALPLTGPSGRPMQELWTMSFGINRDSQHKPEAWKVLSFLTGRDSMLAFAKNIGPHVALKSVMRDPAVVQVWGNDNIGLLENSYNNSDVEFSPRIKEGAAIYQKIGQELSAVISGQQSVDGAVSEINGFAEILMGQGGYYTGT